MAFASHINLFAELPANVTVYPEKSAYPHEITAELFRDESLPGCRLVEEDGNVRLAVLPGRAKSIRFIDRQGDSKDYYLYVTMPARKDAYVDVLLPFIPEKIEDMQEEMALGFERARQESDAFWSQKPQTAAHIETPEEYINDAIIA